MTRTVPITLAVSALALTATACGSDDKPKPAATRSAAATAPYGTYVRDVTKADLARTAGIRRRYAQERGANLELPPTGRYRLTVAKSEAGDVLKVTDPADFTVPVYVKASGDVLALDDYVDPSQGAFCGPEAPARWDYTYELDGDSLRIEARTPDKCADRDALLAGTWTKG